MAIRVQNRRMCHLVVIVCAVLLFIVRALADSPVEVDRNRFVYLSGTNVSFAQDYCSRNGYPTDTVEQIREAMDSSNCGVRHAALTLLTFRVDKEAVPVLRKALGDRDLMVRVRAANLLGRLGDGSGLPVLRRDYDSLVPKSVAAEPNKVDPNTLGPTKYRLHQALRIAQMLAKFGDNRGFELAAKTAINGESAHRIDALYALFEINRWTDTATLVAQNRDPRPIFLIVAESEEHPYVLTEFVNRTVSHTRGDLRKNLLDKIIESAHVTNRVREKAMMFRRNADLAAEREKVAERVSGSEARE